MSGTPNLDLIEDFSKVALTNTQKLLIGEHIHRKVLTVQEAHNRFNISTSVLYKYVRFYRNGILPSKLKTSIVGLTEEEEEIFMHQLTQSGQSLDRLSREEIWRITRKYVGITKREILKHTLAACKSPRVLRKR
jgi:hypothetical protein